MNSKGRYHLQRSMNCHRIQGYSQELESNNSTISVERNQTKRLSCLTECEEARQKSQGILLTFVNSYTSSNLHKGNLMPIPAMLSVLFIKLRLARKKDKFHYPDALQTSEFEITQTVPITCCSSPLNLPRL